MRSTRYTSLRKINPASAIPGVLAAVLLLPNPVQGQDSHWWTNQYGNRARLLGGAVIGSSRDLSAVYYNPGGLAVVDHPEALLTGYVFELDNIRYSDVLFRGDDLSSTRFDVVAGLIAGELPFKFLGSNRIAYSYLTRHNLEYRFTRGATLTGDTLAGFEGIDDIGASLNFESRLREYWGGLTWSRPFAEKYGVGMSMFVANRSQRLRYNSSLTAAGEGIGVASATSLQQYNYYDWRLLAKIGISTSFPRWNVGLTLTTPSLHLFGSGDLGYQSVGVGSGLETVTIDFQEGLSSGYQSSWAIGLGGEYAGEDWKGHVALEWFDRIDSTVIDGNPFTSQTDSTLVVDYDVRNVMKSLVNVALGLERTFSDGLSGYATAYTDFTGKEDGDGSITTTTPWHLWTVGTGAIFNVGRSEFTLGLTYKFGGRDDLTTFGFVPFDGEDPGFLSESARGRFWRLTLILGFKLEFAPDI